ncbi:MAG: exodeoxyribonuclease VII small subunit [Oscillospiraceae bacterium]|nr:exodeoxyribonuclease VII small subunit [Oscillospiraceae bacterium]
MLEEIVSKLESSELSLDESVELYTKGVKLSAQCRKSLDEANLKICDAKTVMSEE